MTKKEAREQQKKLRQTLLPEERQIRNQKISECLFAQEAVRKSKWMFPFVSYGTEVDTLGIIQKALEKKMRVAVPRVEGQQMDFYEITSMGQLKEGFHRILEPVTQERIEAHEGVMLLPGLAFDLQKNRVGYGGGYYDRYLERVLGDRLTTIAIAYDFQIVEQIESEEFDCRPDWIITDQRMF